MSESGTNSVMRWFPHAWHAGELTDSEWEAADSAYASHLEQLRGRVSDSVWGLTEIDLHDGQVQSWNQENGAFEWTLLIGDLQRGYELATFTYTDAELLGTDRDSLDAMLRERGTSKSGPVELLTDEVDLVDSRNEHRFYFWPGHEFGVRFTDVHVARIPATGDLRHSVPRRLGLRSFWSRASAGVRRRRRHPEGS